MQTGEFQFDLDGMEIDMDGMGGLDSLSDSFDMSGILDGLLS